MGVAGLAVAQLRSAGAVVARGSGRVVAEGSVGFTEEAGLGAWVAAGLLVGTAQSAWAVVALADGRTTRLPAAASRPATGEDCLDGHGFSFQERVA